MTHLTRRLGLTSALVAVAALTIASPASADVLWVFDAGEVHETAHEVEIELDGHLVELHVRRTFVNRAAVVDGASLMIDIPSGAIATGLALELGGARHEAEQLLEGDATARFYREPAELGDDARPRRAALLSWRERERLDLALSGLQPSTPVTVEYTLVLPTLVDDGRRTLSYPYTSEPTLVQPAISFVRPIEGATVDSEPDGPATISVPAVGIDVAESWLGHVELDSGRSVARVQIELASPLSAMPSQATVALLIDTSHSMGADGIEAQLQVARSLVAQLPDAHVELIAYDRFARDVFEPGTVRGRDFDARLEAALERGALEPANGSALDLALDLAVERVAQRKPGTAARIVALTDELLRPSWTNQTVLDQTLATLDQDTVLHVVVAERYGPVADARDDLAPLAELPRAHGGVLLRMTGVSEASQGLDRATLGLLRPVRLENLRIAGLETELPGILDEGHGWAALQSSDSAQVSGDVVVHGELWSTPWQQTMARDDARDRLAAGFAFVDDETPRDFTASEWQELATTAGTVTPETLLFALGEEGSAPVIRNGFGTSSACCGTPGLGLHGIGTSGSGTARGTPTIELGPAVATCLRALPDGGTDISPAAVTLAIDTTLREVVDVQARHDDDEDVATLAACLVEAAWALELDASFYERAEHFDLSLP